MTPLEAAKFWTRIAGGQDVECWEWQGRKNQKGYGRFGRDMAHRVAYELTKGPIPEGLIIRHRCDNPACCNPKHLLVGTHSDNSQDALERGRFAIGHRHGHAKLNEDAIRYIRRNPEKLTGAQLAEKFSVSPSTISYARSGRTWSHA